MNDLFSERYGYVKKELQYETLNKRVRNFLWDEVNIFYIIPATNWFNGMDNQGYTLDEEVWETRANYFFHDMHKEFFGESVFSLPKEIDKVSLRIKANFYNTEEWYLCFDTIEAIIRAGRNLYESVRSYEKFLLKFTDKINRIFDQERCPYRLIGKLIVPQLNNLELIAITSGLEESIQFEEINKHILNALHHYSNRKNPDYRNSIKEAISALERLIQIITKAEKQSMGKALDNLKHHKTKVIIHSALTESMDKLYGWTSNTARHANNPESNLESDDAKLAIVTCCSFVSYLISKASKAGIILEKE